ncbi:MAG: choice-of-anchor B family protein [Bacteroidota bacterium]
MTHTKLIITTLLISVLTAFSSVGQSYNLDSLSHIDFQSLHNTNLNDIWGYVDENNNEYAIIGAAKGVSVVDVTDPQNPTEVYWHSGSESTWRDLKVHGDYAYVTTEAEDGLLIIDLSPLPNNPITSTTNFFDTTDPWNSAHNIWIDEDGYAYIFGSDRGNGGVIILDVFTDPMNPVEVGEFDNWYVHDGYVRNDTMYLAHIYEGFFSLVDISDKANPVLLGTHQTPSSFAHNIWPSDDGNYVFTTDEVSDAYLAAYDVTDPTNIQEVDRIQSSPGDEVVPHNAHVDGDFLVTSYYADGVVIHDISDPENMVEVGRYDTYPGTSTSTTGNWGAYPYLPSGNILATDIENGFFVLGSNYDYGAKLEGTITDNSNGNDLQGAAITLSGEPQVEQSDLNGLYKMGVANSDAYTVDYEKYGYEPQSINTSLTVGDTVVQDVAMVPLDDFQFTIKVEGENGDPVDGADVRMKHTDNSFDLTTNGLGESQVTLYYEDTYEIIVGKWGFYTECQNLAIDSTTNSVTVILNSGYYDDFAFDFGWSTTSNAQAGEWERAIPAGESVTGNYPNPNIDSPDDCGLQAFVTDNQPGTEGNVTDGTVTLISPVFDLTGIDDPYVNYERWFYNYHGPNAPDDTLRIVLSNGTDFVTIDKQGSDENTFDQWIKINKRVTDFITPTSNMQLFVSTSDFSGTVNIVDAGFDHFFVSDGNVSSIAEEEGEKNQVSVFPNPFSNQMTVTGLTDVKRDAIRLIDMQGKQLPVDVVDKGAGTYQVTPEGYLETGIYFIQTPHEQLKVIKH